MERLKNIEGCQLSTINRGIRTVKKGLESMRLICASYPLLIGVLGQYTEYSGRIKIHVPAIHY